MRTAVLFATLAVLPGSAHAVDYRWTTGFGQGTTEAIIRNGEGGSVNIYCPAGGTDTTPGIFVESRKVDLKSRKSVDVQFVIDGKNHAFTFEGVHMKAGTRSTRQDLWALSKALGESKSRSFTVEFPRQRRAERFSLLNARDALLDGTKPMVDACT